MIRDINCDSCGVSYCPEISNLCKFWPYCPQKDQLLIDLGNLVLISTVSIVPFDDSSI